MRMINASIRNLWEFLQQDSGGSRFSTIMRSAVMITVVAVGAWVVYFWYVAIATPYQLEYREGAPLVMTRFLLEGKNPFSLENQPLGTNNYGIVYSLTVLPFASAFGNTLLVHRAITAAFILLCFLAVLRTVWTTHRDMGLAIACGAIVVVGLAAWGGLGAFPGSMGAFFFLAALLVPLARGFDRRGLFLSAVLCTLAFYTKPYFMLAIGIVASYVFVFVSKHKALIYSVFFSALLLISALLINNFLPMYFFDTYVSNLSQATAASPMHVSGQLGQLAAEFYPSLIAALAVALAGARQLRPKPAAQSEGSIRIDLLNLDRPLLSRSPDYFLYGFVWCLLAYVFILGLHKQNPMNSAAYSYQLIVPPFFLWLVRTLQPRSRIGLLLMALLLFNLITLSLHRLSPAMLVELRDKSKAWDRLYAAVDGSKRILNSPEIVSEMIRLDMWPVDSGQTEFYFGIQDYPSIRFLGPGYAVIQSNGQRYTDAVNEAVAAREYDAIIATEQWGLPHDPKLIRANYQLTKTITVVMPLAMQKWDIDIWTPIEKGG